MTSSYHNNLITALGDLRDYESLTGYTDTTNETMQHYMAQKCLEGIVFPDVIYHCVCTHFIKQNCYVRNLKTFKVYTVGNCCIKKFKIKKRCSICSNSHQRTKHTICFACESKKKLELKIKRNTPYLLTNNNN